MSAPPEVTLAITIPHGSDAALAYHAQARTTLGVLVQLISQAQRSLVLAAPFVRSTAILENSALRTALKAALERGVQIDLASTASDLERLDLDPLDRIGPGTLRLFLPARSQEANSRLGSHAKFYIADGRRAYVGSANLTYLGLNTHLEMGVLLNGSVAQQVYQLWLHLCDVGFFIEAERKPQ